MAADDLSPEQRRPFSRKLVTAEQLLRLLNQRLEAYGHCGSCMFAGPILQLTTPREDGLNWNRYIAFTCMGEIAPGCRRTAERILDDAVGMYNLWTPADLAPGAAAHLP